MLYGGEDGKLRVKSIYCHWDGYPEYNGKMLIDYYDNNARTEELLELGDISSLDKKIAPTESHTFDKPQKDVTVAYARDRGEEKRILEMDFDDFKDYINHSDVEFVYLRYQDRWLYAEVEYDYITHESQLGAFKELGWKIANLRKNGVIE